MSKEGIPGLRILAVMAEVRSTTLSAFNDDIYVRQNVRQSFLMRLCRIQNNQELIGGNENGYYSKYGKRAA